MASLYEGLLLADGSYPIFGNHIQLPNIQACITHLTGAQSCYCWDTTGAATIPGTSLCHITWLYSGFKVLNICKYIWCVSVCIYIACSFKITCKICCWVSLYCDPIWHYITYSTTENETKHKFEFLISNDTPYLPLLGKLCGVCWEDFEDNWLCYNRTTLYIYQKEYTFGLHLVFVVVWYLTILPSTV